MCREIYGCGHELDRWGVLTLTVEMVLRTVATLTDGYTVSGPGIDNWDVGPDDGS